jgi:hypothetical protein
MQINKQIGMYDGDGDGSDDFLKPVWKVIPSQLCTPMAWTPMASTPMTWTPVA